MKRNILFMACCIGLMLFASCKKDPVAPTVTPIQGEQYLHEGSQVYAEDSVTIGFTATGEKLTRLETTLTQNGNILSFYPETIEQLATYTTSYPITIDTTGTVTITCTVTDAVGQTASTSFNVIVNEKPNAKFVGHYEGNALATGWMEAEITGMGIDPIQDEFTDREVPVVVDIVAGEGLYEVVATCTIEDRTMTATGTVEGDNITFETFNDVITMEYDMGYMTIQPEINVSYTVVATLNGDQLMLEGSCTGQGDMNYGFVSGNLSMEATIGGSLTKTR